MADINVTSTSTGGFSTTSTIGDWELSVDATDENGPNPNAVLVADYASCFIPALRVGAQQEGFDDLGTVQVDVTATLDDNDDLSGIAFDMAVETSLGDALDDVLARAEEICHVHTALREELHAEITVDDGAAL